VPGVRAVLSGEGQDTAMPLEKLDRSYIEICRISKKRDIQWATRILALRVFNFKLLMQWPHGHVGFNGLTALGGLLAGLSCSLIQFSNWKWIYRKHVIYGLDMTEFGADLRTLILARKIGTVILGRIFYFIWIPMAWVTLVFITNHPTLENILSYGAPTALNTNHTYYSVSWCFMSVPYYIYSILFH
jgi:hypothetical protein